MATPERTQRAPEGIRVLYVAGALLLIVSVGVTAADVTGYDVANAVGFLAVPLIACFGLLAGGFRQWPDQIVAHDPFRQTEPGTRARVLSWGYETTGRIRCGAGVLMLLSTVWVAAAAQAVA